MAVKKEDFVKKMADFFEQAIDQKMDEKLKGIKKPLELRQKNKVTVELPKMLNNREVENELIRRYKKAGWKKVHFCIDDADECYAIILEV